LLLAKVDALQNDALLSPEAIAANASVLGLSLQRRIAPRAREWRMAVATGAGMAPPARAGAVSGMPVSFLICTSDDFYRRLSIHGRLRRAKVVHDTQEDDVDDAEAG
jgi:hypothetical protein